VTGRARRERADAVEALIRERWDGAYRAAYLILQDRAAAEDATQEAMLAAVRALDRFDRRRPFRPWLHRIVVNRALDRRRVDVRRAGLQARRRAPRARPRRPAGSDRAR
jgi:RNA polymerase sigma-70 factor (ECF subfamily)